ncbi:hypothetical protein CES87_05935 [Pseudomonas sp. ERMR1:02]|nr:hypothetical protein CES87_05935 [Pseudomonas sp. ERMR1:02]
MKIVWVRATNAVSFHSCSCFVSRLTPRSLVGASLLAMDVNENARCLDKRVVLTFFASKLAPTEENGSIGQMC